MDQTVTEDKVRIEKNGSLVRNERFQNEDQCGVSAVSEAEKPSRGGDVKQTTENGNSSSSVLSWKMHIRRSSSVGSCAADDLSSQQSDMRVDCADIVLNCLFCRFYNLIIMLPGSCERLTDHCCPNYKHFVASMEVESKSNEEDDAFASLDCGLCGSCQDAGDCLELAMEISEICYQ